MEKIWSFAYDSMKMLPEEQPLLITEAPILFESLQVPAMCIFAPGLLAVDGSGRRIAVVLLDIGDGVCHVTIVYRAHTIHHALKRMDIGGRDITDYLAQLLTEQGHNFTTSAEREIVRDIKEKLGYVALNYDVENVTEKSYILPDGQELKLGRERYQCSEALFKPSLLGYEWNGVHEAVYNSIMECDMNVRYELFRNIVISGGSTMFPGFSDRLQKELSNMTPSSIEVKLVCPPERKYSVWIGGSINASLSHFESIIIQKEHYDEYGPISVVNMKK